MPLRRIGQLLAFTAILCALVSTANPAGPAPQPARYLLNASQSKFIAHAFAGGLFWFKGHDHYLMARDFSCEAEITPDSITPASLHLVVKAACLEETGKVFTDQQKQIINKEVKEI